MLDLSCVTEMHTVVNGCIRRDILYVSLLKWNFILHWHGQI